MSELYSDLVRAEDFMRVEAERDEAVALLRDTTLCLERVLKATPVRDADEVLARAKTALATLDGGKS